MSFTATVLTQCLFLLSTFRLLKEHHIHSFGTVVIIWSNRENNLQLLSALHTSFPWYLALTVNRLINHHLPSFLADVRFSTCTMDRSSLWEGILVYMYLGQWYILELHFLLLEKILLFKSHENHRYNMASINPYLHYFLCHFMI